MKNLLTALALSGLCGITLAAPPTGKKPVIVVFHDNTPFHQFEDLAEDDERGRNHPDSWGYLNRGVRGKVNKIEKQHKFKAKQVYSKAINGFAGDLTEEQIEILRSDPNVAYIEPDQKVTLDAQSFRYGFWKIKQNLSNHWEYARYKQVPSVTVYVIDTGVTSHPELNRVGHYSSINDGINYDCHGHGTHVAGTIGSRDNSSSEIGVAPGVRIFGVRTVSCNGFGLTSDVVKAVDYVTANARKPAVANMSLAFPVSDALDAAVKRSVGTGVFYAVSAGNNATDACQQSPARAAITGGIMAVGAIASDSSEAWFSNYGSCVSIWAPGVDIWSLSNTKSWESVKNSGTSMASPHVAGAAALYLSHPDRLWYKPSQVEQALLNKAISANRYSEDGRMIKYVNVADF